MEHEAIAKFITEMTNILKSSNDFVLEQAPDVLRQILSWKLAENILDLIASALLLATAYYVQKAAREYIRRGMAVAREKRMSSGSDLEDYPGIIIFGAMAVAVFGFWGIIGLYSSSKDLIQIRVAPKVFLIEYFAGLAKGK